MNILMLHPHDIYAHEEPWTVRVRSLAEEFVKRGHAVRLIYFPLYADTSLEVHTAPAGYEVIPLSRLHGTGRLFHNIRQVCAHAGWADIIHVQKCFYYASLPALIASFLKRKPLHYDWDDWEIKIYYYAPNQSRIVGFFLGLWEKWLPHMSDTVSYASYRLKEECVKLKVPEERMCKAHVGADITRFNTTVDGSEVRAKYRITTPLVLYLGQLHGGQYAELFIQAAQKVLQKTWDVTFMVVGGGYRLDELRDLAQRSGIEREVIFTGFIDHEIIPRYVAASDMCVACFEDNEITRCKSPLKIVEYLASGKPIVASNVGEVRNMVGGAGILVPPGNSAALADGLLTLLEDEEKRADIAGRARKRAETKYNWGVTAESLLKIYQVACGKRLSSAK